MIFHFKEREGYIMGIGEMAESNEQTKQYKRIVKKLVESIKIMHRFPCDGDCEICAVISDLDSYLSEKSNKSESEIKKTFEKISKFDLLDI
jgi:hypothetical protein